MKLVNFHGLRVELTYARFRTYEDYLLERSFSWLLFLVAVKKGIANDDVQLQLEELLAAEVRRSDEEKEKMLQLVKHDTQRNVDFASRSLELSDRILEFEHIRHRWKKKTDFDEYLFAYADWMDKLISKWVRHCAVRTEVQHIHGAFVLRLSALLVFEENMAVRPSYQVFHRDTKHCSHCACGYQLFTTLFTEPFMKERSCIRARI